MSYYIIEFFKYEIAQGLYIVRDGPGGNIWKFRYHHGGNGISIRYHGFFQKKKKFFFFFEKVMVADMVVVAVVDEMIFFTQIFLTNFFIHQIPQFFFEFTIYL